MYIFQIMLRLVFAWSVAQAAALSASAIYLFVSLGLLSDNILSIPWPIFTGIFFFAALAASVLIFLWCTSPAKLEEVSYEKVVCFNVKSIVRCATWSYVVFLFSALVVFIRPIPAEKNLGLEWFWLGWFNLAQVPLVGYFTFFRRCPLCGNRTLTVRRGESGYVCNCRSCMFRAHFRPVTTT